MWQYSVCRVVAEKLGYEAYQMSAKLDQMNDHTINKIKYYINYKR